MPLSKLLSADEERITYTPWGAPQHITLLAEGIRSVSTASHGGVKLSPERNAQMPDYMRNEDGWYEEDSEWAKVAVVFPDAFGADVVTAYGTLRNWEPDAYEKFTGQALKPGDSHIRDEQTFRRDHANSLIAVSAYGSWASWVPQGFVGVHAYFGGRDEHGHTNGKARAFLVPKDEYDVRSAHGFVIDPAKHQEVPFPTPVR
jgi:hypothetical protein